MTAVPAQRLEIDSLRALCAIEDQGGVSRAAEYMGLSQSAVSHKIKRLETSLDCDLLCRRPNAPVFTDAGQDLLSYAKRILAVHDEALLSLSKSPLQGKIALGMTEDTTCSDLSRVLTRFVRLHPEVSVRAHVHQSLTLLNMLAAGEIDVAIAQVFEHEIRPSDMILFNDTLRWVKSPDLQLSAGQPIPYLSFNENCFYRRWALDVGQESGAVFVTVLDCPSSAGIIAGVRSGLGVALLTGRHLTPDMQVLGDPFPKPSDVAYVVRIARRARNQAAFALAKEIDLEVNRYGKLHAV